MKTTYGLPDGRRTVNATRYCREWSKLMTPFARTFDLRRHACDPGASFQTKDGGQTFSVPLSVLRRFNRDILPRLKS